MTVITLSRQLGAHSEEIATGVAEELGLRLITAETINRAAQKAGVPQMALAELQHEGERGLVNQMIKALRAMPSLRSSDAFSLSLPREFGDPSSGPSRLTMPFAGIFSATTPPISASLDSYVRMVGLVIRGLAQEGNVLIVGRGSQVLLRDNPSALHVQLIAPHAYRVEAIMGQLGLSKRAAQSRIRTSDRARADFLRRYHNIDWLDSTLYHLVINTKLVPATTSVSLIVAASRALAPAGEQDALDE